MVGAMLRAMAAVAARARRRCARCVVAPAPCCCAASTRLRPGAAPGVAPARPTHVWCHARALDGLAAPQLAFNVVSLLGERGVLRLSRVKAEVLPKRYVWRAGVGLPPNSSLSAQITATSQPLMPAEGGAGGVRSRPTARSQPPGRRDQGQAQRLPPLRHALQTRKIRAPRDSPKDPLVQPLPAASLAPPWQASSSAGRVGTWNGQSNTGQTCTWIIADRAGPTMPLCPPSPLHSTAQA